MSVYFFTFLLLRLLLLRLLLFHLLLFRNHMRDESVKPDFVAEWPLRDISLTQVLAIGVPIIRQVYPSFRQLHPRVENQNFWRPERASARISLFVYSRILPVVIPRASLVIVTA